MRRKYQEHHFELPVGTTLMIVRGAVPFDVVLAAAKNISLLLLCGHLLRLVTLFCHLHLHASPSLSYNFQQHVKLFAAIAGAPTKST